ncbi:hypothetical protein HDV05_001944 [Chytridiales sp. JEL 0842]|nr:hypothetical protein HDV05_001944 [Chytridiales sp. JEL 0842]
MSELQQLSKKDPLPFRFILYPELLALVFQHCLEPPLLDLSTLSTRSWWAETYYIDSLIDHDRRRRRAYTTQMYECLLVCKDWAMVAVKELWRCPFVSEGHKAQLMIDTLSTTSSSTLEDDEDNQHQMNNNVLWRVNYASLIESFSLEDLTAANAIPLLSKLPNTQAFKRLFLCDGTGAGAMTLTSENISRLLYSTSAPLTSLKHLRLGSPWDAVNQAGACRALWGISSSRGAFQNLRTLDLKGAVWAGDDVVGLFVNACPNLEEWDLGYTDVTTVGIQMILRGTVSVDETTKEDISTKAKVKALSLAHLQDIRTEVILQISKSFQHTLTKLCISSCKNLTDDIFNILNPAHFPCLQVLDISRNEPLFTERVVQLFNAGIIPQLTHLSVAECGLTNTNLRNLLRPRTGSYLPLLKSLDISEQIILNFPDSDSHKIVPTLDFAQFLIDTLPNLETLVISRFNFDSALNDTFHYPPNEITRTSRVGKRYTTFRPT